MPMCNAIQPFKAYSSLCKFLTLKSFWNLPTLSGSILIEFTKLFPIAPSSHPCTYKTSTTTYIWVAVSTYSSFAQGIALHECAYWACPGILELHHSHLGV